MRIIKNGKLIETEEPFIPTENNEPPSLDDRVEAIIEELSKSLLFPKLCELFKKMRGEK